MNSNTAELEIVAPVEAQLVKYAGESGLSEIKTTPIVLASNVCTQRAESL